jgi:hypothetical protein
MPATLVAGGESEKVELTVSGLPKDIGNVTAEFTITGAGGDAKDKFRVELAGEDFGEWLKGFTLTQDSHNPLGLDVWADSGAEAGDYRYTVTLRTSGGSEIAKATETLTVLSPTPKTATITVADATKTYGETDPTPDVTVTGLQNGDTLDYTVTRGPGEDIGTYAYTVTVTDDLGYAVDIVTGSLTIIPKAATLTVDNKSKLAGESDPDWTATANGLVNNDTLDYSLYRDQGEDEGSSYTIYAALGSNPNYNVTVIPGTLTILSPDIATIIIASSTKVYGDTDPDPVATTVSPAGITYTIDRAAGENVGTYAYTVTVTDDLGYAVNVVAGSLTITPKAAALTIDNKTKTAGTSDPTWTAEASGLVGSDTLAYSLSRNTGEAAGSYTIRATLGNNPNYTVTVVTGILTISEAAVIGGGGGGGGGNTVTIPPTPIPGSDGSSLENVDIEDEETPLAGFTPDHIWYIQGYPDGTVRPDGQITRAEAATIFFRLLSYPDKNDPLTSDFTDVATGKWYTQAIAYLASIGILEGYEDGTFRPDGQITRAEFAALVSRFDDLSASADADAFSDISGHWAADYINSAAEKGWIQGYPDGTFRPQNQLTRAEIVTAVNNMLDRGIELADIPDGVPEYTDLLESYWAYTDIMEASATHDYTRKENNSEIWTVWTTGTYEEFLKLRAEHEAANADEAEADAEE